MKKKIVIILIFVSSGLFIFNQIKNAITTVKSGSQLPKEQQIVKKLEQENAQLQQKLNQVENPEFVEKIARDQLNMSFPGETVVVLPKDQASQSAQVINQLTGTNWQRWYHLFFN